MYRFYNRDSANQYHYAELCRVFLSDDEFEIINLEDPPDRDLLGDESHIIGGSSDRDRDTNKRELYLLLSRITGLSHGWGTLTGVRPLKPAISALNETDSIEGMKAMLDRRYLLSESKQDLLADIANYQREHIKDDGPDHISVYVGIPFCPTRCEYCSFASNVASKNAISAYLKDLFSEIEYTGRLYRKHPADIESIYIGGGTPTSLYSDQLSSLIEILSDAFEINPPGIEFTVEAGRPDTITEDKLAVLHDSGVRRISINPQSMKDDTMKLIGRDHSSDDVRKAYKIAKEIGFPIINADLIAGLPNEDLDDFKASLDEIISMGAENITVHTLSVKRGSRLHEQDPDYYRRGARIASEMLEYSSQKLRSHGYYPYYIYRQKHQMGALENVGYCLKGTHSVYNVRIMEDRQSIIALGAGGVGKLYYPDEDRIERIANVSNYEIYSERFDEMLRRKDIYFGGQNDG